MFAPMRRLAWLAILLTLSGIAYGQESVETKGEKSDKKEAASPPTHTVKKSPFKIDVTLEGVFEAEKMTEVVLRPETWNEWTVLEASDLGSRVRRGEILIRFDPEKIDDAIRDLEAGRKLSELGLTLAETELKALNETVPFELTSAQRAKNIANADLERFLKTDRDLTVRQRAFSVKQNEEQLAYAEEELKQLEKMYKADDLTEETEEIILRRQRFGVEAGKFQLEMAKNNQKQTLEVQLPRQEELLKDGARKQDLNWEKVRVTLPIALDKARLELDRSRYEANKARDRLLKLRQDRELMTINASADGIVYYGSCVLGKWRSPVSGDKLKRGTSIKPEDAFITIVEPRPMFVRVSIPERDLRDLKTGVEAQVAPTGNADLKIKGKVDTVSSIPVAGDKFDGKLTIEQPAEDSGLMPGMACSVKLTAYSQREAITVPPSAVFPDELEADKHYVYVQEKDKKPERREVKPGRKSGDRLEILEGLKESETILLKKPESTEE